MSRFPTIRAVELVKIPKSQGFQVDRQRGSHLMLWHPDLRRSIAVPMHTGCDLGRGLALQILKQAGFDGDDFLNWR